MLPPSIEDTARACFGRRATAVNMWQGEAELNGSAQKRLMDLILGTAAAALALPAILVLSAAAAASLRAWPFFVQQRLGRDGRTFRMLKIRTLPKGSPPSATKYEVVAVETTHFCRVLRMTHLDELPQLLLVPLGRMSLVGPRPEMPELAARADPAFVARRTTVRPGCTGLWQVSIDSSRLISEAPEYDVFYLQHQSLRLDVWILWRTIGSFIPGTPRIRSCAAVPAWARGRASARVGAVLPAVPPVDLG